MKNKVGDKCWQAVGYASLIFGVVVSQEIRNGWLMYEVRWSGGAIQTTWVKWNNIAFGLDHLVHRELSASPKDSVEYEVSSVVKELEKLGLDLAMDPDFDEGIMAFEYEDVRIDIRFGIRGDSFKVFVDEDDSCLVRLDGEDFNSKQLYKSVKNALQQ